MQVNLGNYSFNLEPAVWIGLAEAILILLVAFGVPITPDQKTAVIGVMSALIAVIGSIAIRSQVVPVAKLAKPTT